MDRSPSETLLLKLDPSGKFSQDERRALIRLPMNVVELNVGRDIVHEGDHPTRSCLCIQGFVASSKTIGDGRRQITSLYIPGDLPDLQSLHLPVMDVTFTAMSAAVVGLIPHESIRSVCAAHNRIAAAFWRSTLVDAALYRQWVVCIGQRSAEERMAHLFCEIMVRTSAAGLADGQECDLPLVQSDLADALGSSLVQTNRSVRNLRIKGLAVFRNRRLKILDWKKLVAVADFNPAYLHLGSA